MSVQPNPEAAGPKKRQKKPPTLLDQLASATEAQEKASSDPFPPTWDPGDKSHPNPIVMEAFPTIIKPNNASDPLIEATHSDGRRFTIWVGRNLASKLVRAGVQTGEPCAIRRSPEKHAYTDATTGEQRSAWGWFVETPETLANPQAIRGGRVIDMRALMPANDGSIEVDAIEVESTVELEPDPLPEIADDDADDGIPF